MLKKLNAVLLGIATILAALFIANKRGKAEGKEEEINKQNEEVLKSVADSKKSSDKLNRLSRDELIDRL